VFGATNGFKMECMSRASEGPQEWSGQHYRGRAAAENFSSARSAEKILTYLFFTYEETALVASRYIEGHALTLCIYIYCLL